MRADRIRCLRCGTDLPARLPEDTDKPSASWASARARLLAVAGGLAVVVGLVVVVLLSRGTARRGTSTAMPTSQPVASAGAGETTRPVPKAAAPFVPDPQIIGKVAFHDGDYQAAYDRYRDAVARNPNDAESLSNCGQALVRLGRPAEAIPLFERAIELNPQRWAYHFNLAHTSGLLGQWDRAVQEYQAALEQFPDDYVTEFNLGMALHKRGDEAAAVEHYRRAIEITPDDAQTYLALGMSSERLGRTADAVAAYRRFVEMSPAAPEAPKVRARIEMLAAAPPAPPAAAPAAPPAKGGVS